MKKRKLWPILLVAGITIIGVAAVAVGIGIRNIPSISEQIPPGSTPIHVRITYPDNQTGWPMNSTIPIQISVWGAEQLTNVDLYINNIIYESKSFQTDENKKEYTGWVQWQPGDIGQYIMVAKALDAIGGTGISNTVMIETGTAIGSRSPIVVTAGETLENLAITQNISLEEIQQANPGLDPQQALPDNGQVYLPNPPITLKNPNIIPPFQSNVELPPSSNPPAEGFESGTSKKWTFINDFLFWVNNSNANQNPAPEEQNDPTLPPGPDLYSEFYPCEVYLRVNVLINGNGTVNEDGYFIYRSRDGGKFERVATLPPYDTSIGDSSPWTFRDKEQYGLLTYYAASFNSYGENAGTPVTIPMSEVGCAGPDPVSGMDINADGELILPNNLDMAYLYLQINGSQATRVPEGNRMFLPHSGQKFNLETYLDSLVDTLQVPDLQIHMEVWGWQGSTLVYVGELDRAIHRAILTVCSREGEGACTAGGGGVWVRELYIQSNDIKPLGQQVYELKWQSTSLSEAAQVCLGMGETFNGPEWDDANPIILHRCYESTVDGYLSGQEGTYLLDLGEILYPADKSQVPLYDWSDSTANYQYPDFDLKHALGTPFDVQLRARVAVDNGAYNDVSNTVYMHYYTSAAPTELPALASNVPSMFDIEILEDSYAPPTYEIWQNWACVMVDSDPNESYGGAGTVLCPLSYVECGVNVDCEDPGFWGTIAKAWNIIVDAINEAKSAIVGAIADVIPYCSDSSLCEDAVRAGLDYGITAISGMPPNLPNSDELLAKGITEVIGAGLGEIVDPNAIEYVCGDSCKAEVAAQLQPYLQQAKSYYSQPGCFEPSGHANMFPICVQPPATVHPIQGSYNFPGYVVVRVTRKSTPESVNATTDYKSLTKLHFTVDGENFNRKGYWANMCVYEDNLTQEGIPDKNRPDDQVANWGYHAFGDNALYEPLYETVDVEIPWLEPGQSVDIPISLVQLTNWHPDGNCINTAMNQYLFYKGVSHMSAIEYCYSAGSSVDWVPCTNGGTDYWHFNNPGSPNDVADFFEEASE
jgi:LysM repeat protein